MSWSTFVLEIVNFLILVWILKRFLYKPVLDVIARRRAGIEKTLADAADMQKSAEKLHQQYESRLAEWNQERQHARDLLAREIDAERTKKLEELQTALDREREKARVTEARRQADAVQKLEDTALLQGARFAGRLLQQASGPEMETRLVEMVINELGQLPADRISALRNSYGNAPTAIEVISAYPLAENHRQGLERALAPVAGDDASLHFKQNRELVAGIRITIGAWVLGANLRDELKGFTDFAHDG
ncbi:MAG TPA: F0F1 ATP synthase subunit delta [Xanthomonadales bacterium]